MDFFELNATTRQKAGNGPARQLRFQGLLPAILYGAPGEPVLLSLNQLELKKTLSKAKLAQVLVNLKIKENDTENVVPAMIKEIQKDPVGGFPIHVDFWRVDFDKKIKIKVPVKTIGKSQGQEMGGMLQIIRRELEVYCFPKQIPDNIEIDVTSLIIGEAVHVKEITLPDNVEIIADINFTVVTVLGSKKDQSETDLAGEADETESAEA